MNQVVTHRQATSALPWRDYLTLTKPRVVLLLLLTAIVGMHLATDGPVPLQTLLAGSVGLAFAMAGAAAINHVVDRRIDALMFRTRHRPLVLGRISTSQALAFAVMLTGVSMLVLTVYVNALTALLTLFGFVGYAFIYTLFLKRATPQNIVIGGLAGAMPPLLGWTAVTGQLDPHALLPVIIIFLWTPPHFWPLAIHRLQDYSKADIPMLPVTHGTEFTKSAILHYTLLLCIATLLPYITGMSGVFYLGCSTLLNLLFFLQTWRLKYAPTRDSAMQTFTGSIIYLTLLFLALLMDHYIGY